jgi:hypothetical protein
MKNQLLRRVSLGTIGSPIDEEKTEPMKEYDSVKGGDTI